MADLSELNVNNTDYNLKDAAARNDIRSTQVVSGNPLTLTDAAPINAESLVVELEPQQDLHGYDYPWVGGSHYNQWDEEWEVGNIDRQGQDESSDTTIRSKNYIPCQSNTEYRVLIKSLTANNIVVYFYDTNKSLIPYTGQGAYNNGFNGSNGVFTTPNGTAYMRFRTTSTYGAVYNNDIAINYPSSITTYSSYSNICPITGYTECEVDDVGVNQWDEEWELGDLDSQGNPTPSSTLIRSKNFISVVSSTTYYFKSNVIGYFAQYDANKIIIGIKFNVYAGTTFTTASNARYIKFILDGAYGTTYNHDISINYPSTVTTYEPYHSSNATIQFGQTVYGGSVDFLTGVLTVDSGIIASYNGETLPSTWISDRDVYVAGTTPTTGAQVCYKLAEPTTIQLTPTELKLLLQYNHITTNGTAITLGYQPDNVIGDVKVEIEKCAVDAEFMQFTDGTDTFTDVNLSLDALFHTVSVVGSKIEQKRFICFEVMDKMGGALQGILASCIAFTDGANTPSGTAFRAYIESLQMYVNFRIYGSGGSYTLAYQSETSFSASAFFVRVRMMNNL